MTFQGRLQTNAENLGGQETRSLVRLRVHRVIDTPIRDTKANAPEVTGAKRARFAASVLGGGTRPAWSSLFLRPGDPGVSEVLPSRNEADAQQDACCVALPTGGT